MIHFLNDNRYIEIRFIFYHLQEYKKYILYIFNGMLKIIDVERIILDISRHIKYCHHHIYTHKKNNIIFPKSADFLNILESHKNPIYALDIVKIKNMNRITIWFNYISTLYKWSSLFTYKYRSLLRSLKYQRKKDIII